MIGKPTASLVSGNNRGRVLPSIDGEDPFGSVWAIGHTNHGSVRFEASGGHKSIYRIVVTEPSEKVEVWINGILWEPKKSG